MITFVIPSIGRPCITKTLRSLINQTNPNWRCLVGFDGLKKGDIDENILIHDDRIEYIFLNDRIGELHRNNEVLSQLVLDDTAHGVAGKVRNVIIDHIQSDTEWIAFVDDDDTLISRYVELFYEEKSKHEFDCISFRMRLTAGNLNVLPPFHRGNEFSEDLACSIGISFCVNKKFIDDNNIRFVASGLEDFSFLHELYSKQGKIYISNYVTYNVKGCYYECEDH